MLSPLACILQPSLPPKQPKCPGLCYVKVLIAPGHPSVVVLTCNSGVKSSAALILTLFFVIYLGQHLRCDKTVPSCSSVGSGQTRWVPLALTSLGVPLTLLVFETSPCCCGDQSSVATTFFFFLCC